jgi:hypothetical protein
MTAAYIKPELKPYKKLDTQFIIYTNKIMRHLIHGIKLKLVQILKLPITKARTSSRFLS